MFRVGARVASVLTGLLVVVFSSAAAAQDATPAGSQTGPLVLAPISSAIVFSPDVKVTTVNDATAVLAGAYVGKLIEKKVLVGAGAYWLTEPRDRARMFYAGLVLGTRLLGTDRANLSARGLLGVGRATLFETFAAGDFRHLHHHGKVLGGPIRFGVTDEFWMADPEIRFAVLLTHLISLDVGAGYRVTSARGGLNEPLRGPTGAIGIRFNME